MLALMYAYIPSTDHSLGISSASRMLRRAGAQLLQRLLRQGGPEPGQQAFSRGIQYWDAPNGPAVTQTPIEEEWYNRQRPLLPLLDKAPWTQDDTWIAPNAVVVGDVDLYDQVGLAKSERTELSMQPLHAIFHDRPLCSLGLCCVETSTKSELGATRLSWTGPSFTQPGELAQNRHQTMASLQNSQQDDVRRSRTSEAEASNLASCAAGRCQLR